MNNTEKRENITMMALILNPILFLFLYEIISYIYFKNIYIYNMHIYLIDKSELQFILSVFQTENLFF